MEEPTAKLEIDASFLINGCVYPTIKQEAHQDIFSIDSQQAKHVCPWRLLKGLNIVIRELCHKTRNAACNCAVFTRDMSRARPSKALGQYMTR